MKVGNIATLLVCWGLSALSFWGLFIKLCPFIIRQLGDVSAIIKIIAYALIAYFGGLAVPLCLFILGIYLFFTL